MQITRPNLVLRRHALLSPSPPLPQAAQLSPHRTSLPSTPPANVISTSPLSTLALESTRNLDSGCPPVQSRLFAAPRGARGRGFTRSVWPTNRSTKLHVEDNRTARVGAFARRIHDCFSSSWLIIPTALRSLCRVALEVLVDLCESGAMPSMRACAILNSEPRRWGGGAGEGSGRLSIFTLGCTMALLPRWLYSHDSMLVPPG